MMWKTIATILLVCAYTARFSAQNTFDPSTDTIAITLQRGTWKLVLPQKLLIASAETAIPDLSAVREVRVQEVHGAPYLFFRGAHREQPDRGYTLMVLLEENPGGVWKAGGVYQVCRGVACSACGFDAYWGCACERYGGTPEDGEGADSYCNHAATMGMGLAPIRYD
jgi:hypothetical protein